MRHDGADDADAFARRREYNLDIMSMVLRSNRAEAAPQQYTASTGAKVSGCLRERSSPSPDLDFLGEQEDVVNRWEPHINAEARYAVPALHILIWSKLYTGLLAVRAWLAMRSRKARPKASDQLHCR